MITQLQAMDSWAGPGDEAVCSVEDGYSVHALTHRCSPGGTCLSCDDHYSLRPRRRSTLVQRERLAPACRHHVG